MAWLRTILILFALWLSPGGVLAGNADGVAGIPLLGDYDFSSGRYTLVALKWGRPDHPIRRELGEFYVDDPALLNRLKKTWFTAEPAPMYACGYHYVIHVLDGKKPVESFAVNFETGCGTIVTRHGSYRFDPELMRKFRTRYGKVIAERKRFPSLREGRRYLRRIARLPRLLMAPAPAWLEYDGEFRFTAGCPGHGFDAVRLTKCLDRVRAELGRKFPGERFELERVGSDSDGGVEIEMKCSDALHRRFAMHDDRGAWKAYEARVTLYWKDG